MKWFSMESQKKQFSVGVILPAGGSGIRMKTSSPKQYNYISDKPLIFYTLHAFHGLSWLEYIIVVVGQEYLQWMKDFIEENNFNRVTVVIGAETRHMSIFNGIKAVEKVCKEPDVVLIHDAVRVLVEETIVKQIALSAKQHGAAGVSLPLVSTVIEVNADQFLTQSLDRSLYKASEMPQGFQYQIIKKAYEQCTEEDFLYGTECLLLAMKYCNVKAHIIEGNSSLWKVTHRKDLFAVEGILKESFNMTSIVNLPSTTNLISEFQKQFSLKNLQISIYQADNVIPSSMDNQLFYSVIEFIDLNKFLDIPYSLSNYHKSSTRELKIVHVYVIILKCKEEILENLKNIHDQLKIYDDQCKNTVIVNLILTLTDKEEKLVSMCRDIVWNRTESLSGQIFTIY